MQLVVVARPTTRAAWCPCGPPEAIREQGLPSPRPNAESWVPGKPYRLRQAGHVAEHSLVNAVGYPLAVGGGGQEVVVGGGPVAPVQRSGRVGLRCGVQ